MLLLPTGRGKKKQRPLSASAPAVQKSAFRRRKEWSTLMALEQEIETYRRKLPELLAHKGKYVVIHQDEVVGTFDGFEDALTAGYERFPNEAFLVRQISDTEKVLVTSRSI